MRWSGKVMDMTKGLIRCTSTADISAATRPAASISPRGTVNIYRDNPSEESDWVYFRFDQLAPSDPREKPVAQVDCCSMPALELKPLSTRMIRHNRSAMSAKPGPHLVAFPHSLGLKGSQVRPDLQEFPGEINRH
jgi:hypothetical protein